MVWCSGQPVEHGRPREHVRTPHAGTPPTSASVRLACRGGFNRQRTHKPVRQCRTHRPSAATCGPVLACSSSSVAAPQPAGLSSSPARTRYNNIGWAEVNKARLLLSVPLGSLVIRTLAFPANLVKTRIQTQREALYRGTWHAVRTIARQEGFLAFYKV